jgi:hypothetical protein
LISFSSEMAERMLVCGSNQTRLVTLYFWVEPGRIFFFVLAGAVWQVAGNAKVEDAGLAGHEIDVEGALHGRGL